MTLGPLMIDVEGLQLTAAETDKLRDPRIGGVILFSRNFSSIEQVKELTRSIHCVRSPGLLIAADQEGGRVQRFRDGFVELPPAHLLGHQYDLDAQLARQLATACGWIMAAELLDIGVDISFAPVVDLDLGLSEVIGDRAFHRDPKVVASLAMAFMQGMRDAGMMAVAKHFPGHGGVVADSHLELPEDHRDYNQLTDDLLPYSRLIANGLHGIMMAHVRYPAIDRRIASLSAYWQETELRRKLGFAGVIFSDDLSMSALELVGDITDRVREALAAGADMALICNDPDAVEQTLANIGPLDNPASQARLVSLRPHPGSWQGEDLRQTSKWLRAVAQIAEAHEPPPFTLDG
ncbi:MAG: beta-N-acetylhexosaminidase [Gammaproteobacteria bacterium]|jgi:beta-N-acetylhexosaminidase|nr:beta-N-acetylhexosaminidase [Chromatiales bacterium]MCP4925922.1 beta-N-acetylhexosaminidase [Gammaproteobacteria bacterium]MDP7297600.1 beta-N-acetylhexosaminidase [Gammaproteobacteria bacterium]MDP7419620.1 beta-N-acetylhexosaminidase [Gammaproteobacteria bacterium]MDP7659781.1 beta-N-acetylhexosaminidase [Gammaproteobacteria bacterium]